VIPRLFATRTAAYAASWRSGGTRSATIAWSAAPPSWKKSPPRRMRPSPRYSFPPTAMNENIRLAWHAHATRMSGRRPT
jgi:hypothetical protein